MGKLTYTVHTINPGEESHVIDVESHLVSVDWNAGAAYAGQKAGFEIYTAFVGYNAPFEATCFDETGGAISKVQDKICNDHFEGTIDLPVDMKQGTRIHLDVSFPGNNIDGRSSSIPVLTKPIVSNLKWSADEAERDDVLTLSADVKNVVDHSEVTITIYDYNPDNAHDVITSIPTGVKDEKIELKWRYFYHGDTREIVTKEECEKNSVSYAPPQYFFTVKVGTEEFGREQESKLLTLLVEYPGRVKVLEFEDVLFRFNSTLPSPDVPPEKGSNVEQDYLSGISALAGALVHTEKPENKDRKLLIAGHADTSGDEKPNFDRSKLRGAAVLYLLAGMRDRWISQFNADKIDGVTTRQPEDIQHVLKWVNKLYEDWGCDPGTVDGQIGKSTKRALENFQQSYSDSKIFPDRIGVDGKMGKQTWGAFFDIYEVRMSELLAMLLKAEPQFASSEAVPSLDDIRSNIGWVVSGNDLTLNAVGCGECWPLKSMQEDGLRPGIASEARSQSDRRVEICMFRPDEIPEIVCHDSGCQDSICGTDDCPLWGRRKGFKRSYMPITKEKKFQFYFSV